MSSPQLVNSQQNRDRFSPILERVNRLPTLQVRQRCQELQALFNQYNYKELRPIFPKLIEDIFSHTLPAGWGLNLLQDTRYNPWHDVRLRTTKDSMLSDFKIVRDFLSPSGPLFDLIYKLQADPTVRLEFPIELLPAPTKDSMKQGAVPHFYMNKLSYLAPNCLQLSAFDFYMFHFAYYIISLQSLQPQQNACIIENAVYTSLVEDYLKFFLPLGGRRVPPLPYTGASPGYSQSGSVTQTRQSGRQQNHVNFLRNSHSTTLHRSTSICQSDSQLESIGQENWRSEVMIQVLVEFWLNQNSLYYNEKSFTQQVRANVLPSQDLVRLVRMLIKHLHFFANSAKEVVPSPYHQVEEPLEDLKRCVIPLMVQKNLYAFFRHGFDRWPLDSSFRLMLETWLSFIQPWRYVEQQTVNIDDKEQPLTNRCKKFVAENLHFYTVLYQEYLQRALRHDLAAPKNAQMLFRVAKVFGQTDLHAVIKDAEQRATDYNGVPLARMSSTKLAASGSFISLSSSSSSVSVLQQVAEVEGPSFRYKPLFGIESRHMMEQLFRCMSQVKAMLHSHHNPNNKPKTGFFAWLSGLMLDDDDFANNRAKVESYLEYSESFFAKIFQMEAITHHTSMAWGTPTRGSDQQPPDMSGGELTPLGRYQMANGLRRFNVTYNGNPDLQPIRTYENKHLVRFLHRLSTWLNKVLEDEIKDLCVKDGFIGSVAHQYFHPPYQQSTHLNDETLQLSHNNPRICLRFLASYRTILYILIFFVSLYWMDFSLLGAVLVLFVILLLYGVIGACFQAKPKQHSHMN